MATAKKRTTTTRKTNTKAKTTSKTVSKAAVKRPAAVRQQIWTVGNMFIAGLLLYAGLAAAVVFLMDPQAHPVTVTHLTDNVLLSKDETSFISAQRTLLDIDLRWLLVSLLAVSAAFPALYLTKLRNFYAERVATRRILESRWVELGLSSVIMIEIIALLVGINELMYLKMFGSLMIATCALGWLAERQNEKARRPEWSAYAISIFTGVMPWIAIGTTKLATLFYGGVRSPWYVYAACIVALVGFCLLGLNQLRQHQRRSSWTEYAVVERNYQTISLLTKVAFVGVLLAGLA